MAQAYYTAFTINASQFAGTLTDYPMLIKPTDARFKTIANGGHVADSNGYDIRPYSDSALTSALSYQLVPGTFDGTTGTFEMHVKVASATSGSVVYLGYGDSSLNTDGSTSGAWNSGYKGVWHLANGSSLTAEDGTGVNNGTVNNATAGTGQVDGCATFNGTTADITVGTNASLNITTLPITIEAWIKKNASTTVGPIFAKRIGGGGGYCFAIRSSGANVDFTKAAVEAATFTSVVPSNTNWHYIAVVCDATSARCHVDPTTNSATATQAITANIATNSSTARIGYDQENLDRFTGSIDEVRISNVTRSGDWLLASYNNQLAPGTFYAIGTEQAVGGGATAIRGRTIIVSPYFDPAATFDYATAVSVTGAQPGIIPATVLAKTFPAWENQTTTRDVLDLITLFPSMYGVRTTGLPIRGGAAPAPPAGLALQRAGDSASS